MDTSSLLTGGKTVAMVGLSDKPDRPSHEVGLYLKAHGFTVIPVNPMLQEVFGLQSYPSISAIPSEIPIDIVDIFRKPDQVASVIDDVFNSGRKPVIWMQEGVGSLEAKAYAEARGLSVVMDICMMKEHRKMAVESR